MQANQIFDGVVAGAKPAGKAGAEDGGSTRRGSDFETLLGDGPALDKVDAPAVDPALTGQTPDVAGDAVPRTAGLWTLDWAADETDAPPKHIVGRIGSDTDVGKDAIGPPNQIRQTVDAPAAAPDTERASRVDNGAALQSEPATTTIRGSALTDQTPAEARPDTVRAERPSLFRLDLPAEAQTPSTATDPAARSVDRPMDVTPAREADVRTPVAAGNVPAQNVAGSVAPDTRLPSSSVAVTAATGGGAPATEATPRQEENGVPTASIVPDRATSMPASPSPYPPRPPGFTAEGDMPLRHVSLQEIRVLNGRRDMPAPPDIAGRGPAEVPLRVAVSVQAAETVQQVHADRPPGPRAETVFSANPATPSRPPTAPSVRAAIATAAPPPAVVLAEPLPVARPTPEIDPVLAAEDTLRLGGELSLGGTDTRAPLSATLRILVDPAMPRQIAIHLAEAARQMPDRPVEISLNPDELGRVRMTLAATDGSMTVTLAVERGETADLLRRHLDDLAQEFRRIGFEEVAFSFDGGGSTNDGDRNGSEATTGPAIAPPDRQEDPALAPLNPALSKGMDLRL